jgi:NADH-quinone oxidoreductase subunit L
MLMLVMANNFLQLFFGWEAVGLVSYLLIGFWYTRPTAIYANLKAFLVNRVGDFGFLLGIALILANYGSLDYGIVFAKANAPVTSP